MAEEKKKLKWIKGTSLKKKEKPKKKPMSERIQSMYGSKKNG